jgi:CubicO group peptidase (beta-lactamase class C family)
MDAEARIARVLAGLRPAIEVKGDPPVRWTLAERMAFYKIPGVSVAVVDGGKIAWARGFGVKAAGGHDPVTPDTLFQAASISKPFAALATMRLVEDGRLDLDADVNHRLQAWKVPESELTKSEKVTLRRIMSHTSGLSVHGFLGFAAGEPLPTLPQILDGKPPAKNPPVRVEAVPGKRSSYSGGGVTVMQLLVGEVTGEPYDELLRRTVLAPLGMTQSTFAQPLPAALAPQAAAAHDAGGKPLPGRWHTYPMLAAAGLWTTPTDLARMIVALQDTYAGRAQPVVRQRTLREMLTVVRPPFGLGFGVDGSGQDLRFSHNGGNDGYRGTFLGYAERGKGLAILVNSDNAELQFEIQRAIATEYGWPDTFAKEIAPVPLSAEQIAAFVGSYRLVEAPGVTVTLSAEGGNIYYQESGDAERIRLLPTADGTLVPLRGSVDVRPVPEKSGPVQKLLLQGGLHPAVRKP